MSGSALVLAAHGSRHEPAVNEQVRDWALQVASRTNFDEVAVAFHQGQPGFCEVLDSLKSSQVTVVPVMTSAGYYCDTVLPRELAHNRRFGDINVHLTPPVGLHNKIPLLVRDRVHHVMRDAGISIQDCALGLVGHGTPRHPASRNSTFDLATKMCAQGFPEVVPVFLDDEPQVERVLELATRPAVVLVPFLIAAGPHATSDIPRRIGIMNYKQNCFPIVETVGQKTVCCDRPFGIDPAVIDLIIDLALAQTEPACCKEVA